MECRGKWKSICKVAYYIVRMISFYSSEDISFKKKISLIIINLSLLVILLLIPMHKCIDMHLCILIIIRSDLAFLHKNQSNGLKS